MTDSLFRAKAPAIMRRLIGDFPIGVTDAAAILGNAGHESGGLASLQELRPRSGRGGWGWFQWTGSRRRDFEAFAAAHGLDAAGDEANYKFLVYELRGSEKHAIAALQKAKSLADKVVAFEQAYERAGVKNYSSRQRWAEIAMEVYQPVVAPGAPISSPVVSQEGQGMWKDFVGKAFTRDQFAAHLASLQWTTWKPVGIVLHNTAAPTLAQWAESGSAHDARIRNLQKFYEDKGWHGGPHWFVSRDYINEFSNPLRRGTHSPSFNATHFGIEMVGDYAKESFDSGDGAKVRDNAVFLMAMLCRRFGFNPDTAIKLHKEDPRTTHDCPGKLVNKADVIARVKAEMARLGTIADAPAAPAPGAPVSLPTPAAAPVDKKDAKDLGWFAGITAAAGSAWHVAWGSGAFRVVLCLAAAFAIYWFVVRPVLRRLDALQGFYQYSDALRGDLVTRLRVALKGVKTQLWGRFLALSGPLLAILQYADVVDLSAVMPPVQGISPAVYVPLVLTPLLGLVNNWLRSVSNTPVGQTDLAIAGATTPADVMVIEPPRPPAPAPRPRRKRRPAAKPKARRKTAAKRKASER